MKPSRLILSLTLSLLVFSTVAAQTSAKQEPQTKDRQQEAQKALEKKALALLEEVITDAPALKLAENRIRVQATAADLLWTRDEKRARALFLEAQSGLGQLMSKIEGSDPNYHGQVSGPSQLRNEMLEIIARRDPVLALDFLRATRQPPPFQWDPRYKQEDIEVQMETRLVARIAEKDPKLALQIAEESLKRGISYELLSVLNQLRSKDAEAAARLADLIMEKLQAEDLETNPHVLNVCLQLFQQAARPQLASGSGSKATSGDDSSRLLGESDFLRLLDMLISTSSRLSTAGFQDHVEANNARSVARSLKTILPDVEKYAPTRAPALRKKLAEFERFDPEMRVWGHHVIQENGSVESLLEAAKKAPPGARYNYYHQAAWKAVSQGDADHARRIISDNIPSPHQRAEMLWGIEYQAIMRAAEQGRMEEALTLTLAIPSNEKRARMFIALGRHRADKQDKKEAVRLLDNAWGLLRDRAGNYEQLIVRLELAQAYAAVEPARSLEVLEANIDHLNELIAAAAVLTGFENQYFSEEELKMQGGGSLTECVKSHAEALASVASVEFDRARLAADRFQRVEARILARLAIARGILTN